MDAASLEHVFRLLTKLYTMMSPPLLTRIHEFRENTSIALDIVQRPGSDIHEGVVRASVLRSRKCVEGGDRYVVRDRERLFLEQVSQKVERAETAV